MLNDKAKAIYAYIRQRIDEGYAPTVREICNALDIRSTSTVHRYVGQLVEEGLLDKLDNQNRAIRLHGNNARSIPIIRAVMPDLPLTAPEHTESYVSYAPAEEPAGTLFAVRVTEDTLHGNGILSGDIIIAEETDTAGSEILITKTAEGVLQPCAADTMPGEPIGKAIALIRQLNR